MLTLRMAMPVCDPYEDSYILWSLRQDREMQLLAGSGAATGGRNDDGQYRLREQGSQWTGCYGRRRTPRPRSQLVV
jgi:hypothetical protein